MLPNSSRVKFLPRTLLLIAFSGLSMAAAAAESEADVRQQVEAAERAAGKAIATQDFPALEKLWSPQMLVNSPGNRVLDRQQVFAAMREGKLNYQKYETTVEDFRVYGDIAVEMGREVIVPGFGPEAGKTFLRRYTNIWQRSGNAWVQVVRQATYTTDSDMYAPSK